MSIHLDHLKALHAYLKPSGTATLSTRPIGQLDTKEYILRYRTDGNVPFTWPVTGVADFEFLFNEIEMMWQCKGSMFGVSPDARDPKTWLHGVSQGIKSREQVLKGFLSRANMYWERYRGDLDQFAFRLGLELAATGTMNKTDFGWCWTHTSHPDIQVCFSPDNRKPGFGQLPQSHFGFYSSIKTHEWYVSTENLTQMHGAIAQFSADARRFCEGASACFGAPKLV